MVNSEPTLSSLHLSLLFVKKGGESNLEFRNTIAKKTTSCGLRAAAGVCGDWGGDSSQLNQKVIIKCCFFILVRNTVKSPITHVSHLLIAYS